MSKKKTKDDVILSPASYYLKTIDMGPEYKTPNILEEASNIIYNDRAKDYGTVTDNFTKIAKLWSTILDREVTPKEVGLCMIALKLARETNKSKRDNLVDIAGYAGTLEKLEKGE